MANLTRTLPALVLCTVCGFVTGCGDVSLTDLGLPADIPVSEWVSSGETVDGAFEQLLTLADSVGGETAKRQVADALAADPAVQATQVTEQGVWVDYRSGASWLLLLDTLAGDANSTDPFAEQPLNARSLMPAVLQPAAAGAVKPHFTKAVLLNSIHSEFFTYSQLLLTKSNAALARINAAPFVQYLDEECTLDKYRDLNGCGIIFLGGHGCPRTDADGGQEVFLLTGHRIPDDQSLAIAAWQDVKTKYAEAARQQQIRAARMKNGRFVIVSPDFVTSGLNLSGQGTLVWLGFCLSWTSTWQDKFIDDAHASACLGWDKPVLGVADAAVAWKMFEQMCDTSYPSPVTLAFWYENSSAVEYRTPGTGETVRLRWRGNRDLTLWEPGEPALCTKAQISGKWRRSYDSDCDGKVEYSDSDDAVRVLREDGSITLADGTLLDDEGWGLDPDNPGRVLFWYSGSSSSGSAEIAPGCGRMTNGHTFFYSVIGSISSMGCWTAVKE